MTKFILKTYSIPMTKFHAQKPVPFQWQDFMLNPVPFQQNFMLSDNSVLLLGFGFVVIQ